jgi:hypothetical protein
MVTNFRNWNARASVIMSGWPTEGWIEDAALWSKHQCKRKSKENPPLG